MRKPASVKFNAGRENRKLLIMRSFNMTTLMKKVPDSSEDLEVEDDERDDGDDAGAHQPRPVDVEPGFGRFF